MNDKKVFLIPCSDYKDLIPVDSGYQFCPPDYCYGPSARNYTILHYVVSGKGILQKNGTEHTVRASQCFIIRSGETAYYKSDSSVPWVYVWLGFRTSLPLPEPIASQDVIDGQGLENVFIPIMKHSSSEPQLSVFLCGKCWELFSLLMHDKEKQDNTTSLQRARIYIENEYMNNITVAGIADMLFTDRTVFSKAFHRSFGVSPQEYLCTYRLEKAREFIKSGKYTLAQTALMCGYTDYGNFSRMFSRRYKQSPREYSKQHKSVADEK